MWFVSIFEQQIVGHLKLNDWRAAPKMANDRMADERHQVQGSPPNFLARIHLQQRHPLISIWNLGSIWQSWQSWGTYARNSCLTKQDSLRTAQFIWRSATSVTSKSQTSKAMPRAVDGAGGHHSRGDYRSSCHSRPRPQKLPYDEYEFRHRCTSSKS